MRPCVRAATLDGYVELARSLGLDPVGLLGSVGLDVADLATPEKWIPAADVARLLQLSADRSGHEDLGLLLAARRRLATLGPLSVVLRQEPDLRSALALLGGYERSYNEALHLRLDEANGLATIRLWLEFTEPAPVRQSLELATAALHGIIGELLGRGWEPLAVCFAHPPPEVLRTHHATFGPRLRFDHPFTGLVFYADQLDAPNAVADPLLRPYARQFLRSIPAPRGATVAERVREHVEVLLPLGRCSTSQVARSLGMTERTMHRRLAAQDESFTGIVNARRAALAERYLADDRHTLTDVAHLLGFTAPSAFSRWFRTRFGVTPSRWRATVRRAAGGGSPPSSA
ncbi:AraC family transcriptional regulator [Geodermatophilus sp. SYSU D01186]